MAFTDDIEGKYITLRSARVEDTEFTRNLRRDPNIAKMIPMIDSTLAQQKAWLLKQREKDGDYFFVVWNKKNEPIGTISLYETNSDNPQSGRLAIKGDAFENSEASYLHLKFGFETLKLLHVAGFIYSDNRRAIHYSKQFGAIIQEPVLDEDGRLIVFTDVTAEGFKKREPAIIRMLYGRKE